MDWFREDELITRKTFEVASKAAALSCFATHKPRIFEKGMNAEGKKIGKYAPATRKRKAVKGVTSSFVNLTDESFMKDDYEVGDNPIGFGFSQSINYDKSNWNEDRYGELIFALTDQEEEIYMKVLSDQLGFK